MNSSQTERLETATFGAGCFWGVEEMFRTTEGVVDTSAGYMGGVTDNPTYRDVCTDRTGHAEVVQVRYDPTRVSYEQLLDVFWSNHNPTTLNRQGPDVGSQYRSVVFVHSPEQRELALSSKATFDASGRYPTPAVTQIVEAMKFYPAEEYHQKYLFKRGISHCHI